MKLLLSFSAVVALIFAFTAPAAAQTFNITVNSTPYTVLLENNRTYVDINGGLPDTGGVIDSAPWWGVDPVTSPVGAQAFANALNTQQGASLPTPSSGVNLFFFAYADASPLVSAYALIKDSGGSISVGPNNLNQTGIGAEVFIASIAPASVAVPEINGSALAQMLLVLTVLGTCMAARRMRQAQV